MTHYADLLKYICKQYFNWDGVKDERGRTILQFVGTDTIRKQAPDYWVDFIIDMLTFFGDNWDFVIIPDTRFPNEIDKLRSAGFDVDHLRVVRPDFQANLTVAQRSHPSETSLDDTAPDCYVVNDGSLEDLIEDVYQLSKEYANEKTQE